MMNFEQAIEIVLKSEGGYSIDPHDAGGETNFGISKRQYPDLDIKNLTLKHARMIYERDYWNKVQAMALPEGIRLMVFDTAVNQGVSSAIVMLQNLVKTSKDAIIGPNTIKAVESYKNSFGVSVMATEYARMRSLKYIRTKGFEHFGKGWINRVFDILRASEEALYF